VKGSGAGCAIRSPILPRVEPTWLSAKEVEAINIAEVVAVGEAHAVLFPGGLQAAVARPKNHWENGEDDVVVLAAILCCGIAQRHCFEAANKRTGIVAAGMFLDWNGYVLLDDRTLGPQVERVVCRQISERQFAEILRPFVMPE
jgi:death on curing protein